MTRMENTQKERPSGSMALDYAFLQIGIHQQINRKEKTQKENKNI